MLAVAEAIIGEVAVVISKTYIGTLHRLQVERVVDNIILLEALPHNMFLLNNNIPNIQVPMKVLHRSLTQHRKKIVRTFSDLPTRSCK